MSFPFPLGLAGKAQNDARGKKEREGEKEETVSFPTPHPFSFTFFLLFSLRSFVLSQ